MQSEVKCNKPAMQNLQGIPQCPALLQFSHPSKPATTQQLCRLV